MLRGGKAPTRGGQLHVEIEQHGRVRFEHTLVLVARWKSGVRKGKRVIIALELTQATVYLEPALCYFGDALFDGFGRARLSWGEPMVLRYVYCCGALFSSRHA